MSEGRAATFKVWKTGPNNWHVYAKHDGTGEWMRADGLYTEVAAMFRGNVFCDFLEREAAS